MGSDAWGWGMGGLSMLLFWGLVIVALVMLGKWLMRGTGSSGERTPLEILKERYAQGEIERDEFEQKKRDLGG